MKTKLFLVGAALSITAVVSAQRKELRNLRNAVDDQEYAQAKIDVQTLEGMLAQMDEDDKEEFYYYKAKTFLGKEDDFSGLDTALEAIDMASKTNDGDDYGDEVAELKQQAMNKTIKSAVEDQNAERYDAAATKLNKLYTMSPKDTIYLYYAASNAVNGEDYDTALKYYEQLKDLGYRGVETQYSAMNMESGKSENFGSEQQRDLMVKAGSHSDPKIEKTPPKSPDIAEKIALIYMQKGEDQKALDAMSDARAQNPDNVDLMKNEAELYRKLDMYEEYEAAMDKIIAKDPNNADLLVNIGISANNAGNSEKAMEYYKKALDIDPDNSVANLNTAVALLAKDKDLVEQMNNLGTSAADNKKYEAFKSERMDIYKGAIPYLEKAADSDPNNVEVIRTLFNIHSQVGNTEKAADYKAKLESLDTANEN